MRSGRYKILFADAAMQVHPGMPQTPPAGFTPSPDAMCSCPRAVNKVWLFDVINDPWECNNLAESHPEIVSNLTAAFDRYRETAVPDLALSHGKNDPSAKPWLREDQAWGPFVNSKMCIW